MHKIRRTCFPSQVLQVPHEINHFGDCTHGFPGCSVITLTANINSQKWPWGLEIHKYLSKVWQVPHKTNHFRDYTHGFPGCSVKILTANTNYFVELLRVLLESINAMHCTHSHLSDALLHALAWSAFAKLMFCLDLPLIRDLNDQVMCILLSMSLETFYQYLSEQKI